MDAGDFLIYIFSNNGDRIAVWHYNQFEFSITTSLSKDKLVSMVKVSYLEGV